jgi:hypothetical protein
MDTIGLILSTHILLWSGGGGRGMKNVKLTGLDYQNQWGPWLTTTLTKSSFPQDHEYSSHHGKIDIL